MSLYCINDPGVPWGHPPRMATDKCIINSPLKQTLTSDQKLQKAFFGNWRKESLTKKKKGRTSCDSSPYLCATGAGL